MAPFDPNAPATAQSGIFGLPFDEAGALVAYLPVPWEATTSYGGGASRGPGAILAASHQVDLYDLDVRKPYEAGLFMLAESPEVRAWNERAKALAQRAISARPGADEPDVLAALAEVNALGQKLNEYVRRETARLDASGKIVGVIGGDHSVPFGAIEAIAAKRGPLGVLHIDAHSDTRRAYEGFTFSHASIMRNVCDKIAAVERLVQVGLRDVCEEEMDYARAQSERIRPFYDRDIARRKLWGERFGDVAGEIVAALPHDVWISFDIDGLDPRLCPHTGTPVPGGLDLAEACFILSELVRSGRTIVGFDLDEVAPNRSDPHDEWDANVGARLLYKLTAWTLASQGKAEVLP